MLEQLQPTGLRKETALIHLASLVSGAEGESNKIHQPEVSILPQSSQRDVAVVGAKGGRGVEPFDCLQEVTLSVVFAFERASFRPLQMWPDSTEGARGLNP